MEENCCCEMMKYWSGSHCSEHDSPFECPDWLIVRVHDGNEYGLVVHDGGESFVKISYCPWCGRKL